MLTLRSVNFIDVQPFFVDFQRHSKCFEMPPEEAEFIGIYKDEELIGYFITVGYDDGDIDINQGYLKPAYRHKEMSVQCTHLLEEMCKKAGFKKMLLGTHNRFKSYLKFAKDLGYTPSHLVFHKEL